MKIEDGIPVPAISSRGRPRSEAGNVALQMQVNQSVLCADESQVETMRAMLRRVGRKYAVRKIAGEGWRLWRIG